MSTAPPNSSFPLIAGRHAGIPVHCAPQVKPVYDRLVTSAQSGNHWAQLIVNGIQSLVSGRLHLNNVFVKESNALAYGNGRFILVLPGCTATFEKLSSREFALWHLAADENYSELQKTRQRPGLFKVTKMDDAWRAEFAPMEESQRKKFAQ